MIDVVVTQRVNAGMEAAFEALAREVTANTLSQDKGCLWYEWYRADAPQTYILIERWTDLWGEIFAVMADIGFFSKTGDRYQMTIPKSNTHEKISAALLRLVATQDENDFCIQNIWLTA